jgi:hypothetical protein
MNIMVAQETDKTTSPSPPPKSHTHRVTSSTISPHVYHLINRGVRFIFSISYPVKTTVGHEIEVEMNL